MSLRYLYYKLTPRGLKGVLAFLILLYIMTVKEKAPALPHIEDPVPTPAVLADTTRMPGITGTPAISQTPVMEKVTIKRVIDGDTVELQNTRRLRYIGIDTPEVGDCYFKEAFMKNSELVLGKEIIMEKDVSEVDRYGRLLRYVWLGGELINEKLVREGYAKASTYPPDVKHNLILRQAEVEAREGKRGFWGDTCNSTITPTF